MLERLHPDVEIRQTELVPWGGHYRGHEGAREFFGRVLGAIDSTVTVERFIDAGDHVAAVGRTRGRTRAGDVRVRPGRRPRVDRARRADRAARGVHRHAGHAEALASLDRSARFCGLPPDRVECGAHGRRPSDRSDASREAASERGLRLRPGGDRERPRRPAGRRPGREAGQAGRRHREEPVRRRRLRRDRDDPEQDVPRGGVGREQRARRPAPARPPSSSSAVSATSSGGRSTCWTTSSVATTSP